MDLHVGSDPWKGLAQRQNYRAVLYSVDSLSSLEYIKTVPVLTMGYPHKPLPGPCTWFQGFKKVKGKHVSCSPEVRDSPWQGSSFVNLVLTIVRLL